MVLHSNAKLTVIQRTEIRRLHQEERVSIRKLAELYHVTPKTIHYWVRRDIPLDKSSAPLHHHTVVTEEYREAVVAYRRANPTHGAVRIAYELSPVYPQANRGNISRILKAEHLTEKPKRSKRSEQKIPVGRHRVQMDVQALPAVKGSKKREYKISLIHTATRIKYSEIHSNHKSKTLVEVFQRALEHLPLFT